MDISNYHLEFFRKQFDFFGMVSMKLWVGEEKRVPDYFKVGEKNPMIKEYVLILMSSCKREDSYNEKKLMANIIFNMVTYWQFVSNNLGISVFPFHLWEAQ